MTDTSKDASNAFEDMPEESGKRSYPTRKDFEERLREFGEDEIHIPNYRKVGTRLVLTADKLRISEARARAVIYSERYRGYIPSQLYARYLAMLEFRYYLRPDDIDLERKKIESLISEGIAPFRDPSLYGSLLYKSKNNPPGPFPIDDYIIEFGSGEYMRNRSFRAMDRKKGNIADGSIRPQHKARFLAFVSKTMTNAKVDPDFIQHLINHSESNYDDAGIDPHSKTSLRERIYKCVKNLESALGKLSPSERKYKKLDRSTIQTSELVDRLSANYLWYLDYCHEDRQWIVSQLELFFQNEVNHKKDAHRIFSLLLPFRSTLGDPDICLNQVWLRRKIKHSLDKINTNRLRDVSKNDVQNEDVYQHFERAVKKVIENLNLYYDDTARVFLLGSVREIYPLLGISPLIKGVPKFTAFLTRMRIEALHRTPDERLQELITSSDIKNIVIWPSNEYQTELYNRVSALGLLPEIREQQKQIMEKRHSAALEKFKEERCGYQPKSD